MCGVPPAHPIPTAAALAAVVAVSACGLWTPNLNVTLTNRTGRAIRVTGNCVDDPHSVAPGQTDNALYLGADCRIDNGDGLHGLRGCVTLRHRHTVLTEQRLRKIREPNDCWRAGSR